MEPAQDVDRHSFGDVVRDHRLRRGLSQEELAAGTGIAIRSIRNIEAGRVGQPRPSTVRLLAEAFGLAGPDRAAFTAATLAGAPGPDLAGPAQLPRDIAAFAGRSGDLDRLDALLPRDRDEITTVPVISGTAGVGKTSLAVHWAHRVAQRFPDGQLYVNLYGFGPGDTSVTPDDALADFLVALGVPRHSIPTTTAGRAALFRSHLAGRRALILLDNARDAEQVRPLLPGTGRCLAIVTSRRQLTSLIATDNATAVPLDLLTEHEARELLERRIGAPRLDVEPATVSDLITGCDRLPLALAIVAARAAVEPDTSLADLADQLRHPATALDTLDGGDRLTDVRAVFSFSYRSLPASARRLFQVFGLHPGPDLDLYAAANLADLTLPETRHAMAHLVRSHLATARPGGRYTMHDLLRAYAIETARDELGDEGCRAAVRRLLTFYRHTVVQLRRMLLRRHGGDLPADEPAVPTPFGDDEAAGAAWVEAERVNLVATAVDAGRHGFHDYPPIISLLLWVFLRTRGFSNDCLTLSGAAVQAARASGDTHAEAGALSNLAGALMPFGRYTEAVEHAERSLQLLRVHGLPVDKEAALLCNLVEVYLAVGDMRAAERSAHDALRLSRHAGMTRTEALASLRLAWVCRDTGSLDEALAHATDALRVLEASTALHHTCEALMTLGTVHLRRREYDRARHQLLRSQELLRSSGQYGDLLGWTLHHLGRLSRRLGERQAAARYLAESLDLGRSIDDMSLQAATMTELGLLAHENGRADEGIRLVREALATSTGIGHRRTQAPARNALGEILLAIGDVPRARHQFSAALQVATALGDPDEQDRARAGLQPRRPARGGVA